MTDKQVLVLKKFIQVAYVLGLEKREEEFEDLYNEFVKFLRTLPQA